MALFYNVLCLFTVFSTSLIVYRSRMNELKDCDEEIDYQTDYLVDIAKEANYGYDLDTAEEFHAWEKHKRDNILTYRDQSYTSKFTGNKSPIHHTTWIKALNDSMETFLNTKK